MARPNLRIDVTKRVGKPIAFSVNDRLAIEAKYGHKLTSEQWKQITDVTSVLTIYIPGINVASSARLVLSKFKKLEAAAKSLRSEFSKTPDYEIFTPQEIYWTFFARRQRPPRLSEEFQFLEDILGAVTKFSEFAVQQLQKPNPKQSNHWFTLSESDVWNIWVNELTEIMKDSGLPYKIRKDRDKNTHDTQSSFVMFIKELQKVLPKECRKFTQSDYALAQGISRARRRK
jgi:hypothetical protein